MNCLEVFIDLDLFEFSLYIQLCIFLNLHFIAKLIYFVKLLYFYLELIFPLGSLNKRMKNWSWIPLKLVIPSHFILQKKKNHFLILAGSAFYCPIIFGNLMHAADIRKWVFSLNKTWRNYKFAWNSWYTVRTKNT